MLPSAWSASPWCAQTPRCYHTVQTLTPCTKRRILLKEHILHRDHVLRRANALPTVLPCLCVQHPPYSASLPTSTATSTYLLPGAPYSHTHTCSRDTKHLRTSSWSACGKVWLAREHMSQGLGLCLCLALALALALAHALSLSRARALFLSLCLSVCLSLSLSRARSLSLSRSHTSKREHVSRSHIPRSIRAKVPRVVG
jgi:hypothetical protein